ncbi:MAG: outer membrane protein [Legionellales bacterium]
MLFKQQKYLSLLATALLVLSTQATLAASRQTDTQSTNTQGIPWFGPMDPVRAPPTAASRNPSRANYPTIDQTLESLFPTLIITTSFGLSKEGSGQKQTIRFNPTIIKAYVANQNTGSFGYGELFVGIEKSLSKSIKGQLGVAFSLASSVGINGIIWDNAQNLFDNYTYQYQIKHKYLAIKGKLLADKGYWVMPWISASLGVGLNQSQNFTNTARIEEAVVNNNFANKSKSTFAYTVGAGIERKFTEAWRAGIGYEFADWGQSHLGSAPGQLIGSGPSLSSIYTNSILFSISYVY